MTSRYRLSRKGDGEVAVDMLNEWQPMTTCPRGALVQLLGQGDVAVHARYDGKSTFWKGWCPMPKTPEWMKAMT